MVSTATSVATRGNRRRTFRDAIYAPSCDDRPRRRRMSDVNAVTSSIDAPPLFGGRPAFAEVAAEQLAAVFRYLVYLTGDRSAAEDLTAETFEKAFRSWRRFDPRRGSPRTWLCSIARSVAVDWYRAETRRRRREEAYARELDEVQQFGDDLPGEL